MGSSTISGVGQVAGLQDESEERVLYREEDLMGLKLEGTSVYDAEKKTYLKVINDLM